MVICHCRKVNSTAIKAAVEDLGDNSYVEVLKQTGACRGCGSCAPRIVELLATMSSHKPEEGTSDAP